MQYILIICVVVAIILFAAVCVFAVMSSGQYNKSAEDKEQEAWVKEHMQKLHIGETTSEKQ